MIQTFLIYYNSILSFLFWIIRDTTLQKKAEIIQKNKATYIKTNKFEGKIFSLNKYFVLMVKYFFPLIVLFMLFVFSFHILEAYFIYGFSFILLILFFTFYFKDKQYKIFTAIFTTLYLILAMLFVFKYNLNTFYLLQLLFNSLHVFLCYLIIFKIYKDYCFNKNKKFYFDKNNKLIISFDKKV